MGQPRPPRREHAQRGRHRTPRRQGHFPIPVLPAGVPAVAVFLNLGHTVTASLVVDDSLAGAEQLAPLLQQALEELAEMVRP
jgi:diacylglycerol O-acyltransferase